MKTGMWVLLLQAGALFAAAPDEVLDRYKALRPADADLAIYRLDWCPDHARAQERAARENRPLLLISVNNISGGGNIRSGHC